MSILDQIVQKSAEFSHANQRKQQVARLFSDLSQNAKEDSQRFPLEAQKIPSLLPRVRESLKFYLPEFGMTPVSASVLIFPERDYMSAMACILPPIDGGKEISLENVLEALSRAGILFGMQVEIISEFVGELKYLHLFPIAYGKEPVDGLDGEIIPKAQPSRLHAVDLAPGEQPDFANGAFQPIEAGEVICSLRPPVPGCPGKDIRGKKIPVRREAAELSLPVGLNVKVSSNGLRAVALTDGLLFQRNGRYFVRAATLVIGPISGTILSKGKDVYIEGDVNAGARVIAHGNVIVDGKVRNAEVCADNGSVWVSKGIWGGQTMASHQIQTLILDEANVNAEGIIYAQQILYSDVTSGSQVIVSGGDGIIAGGSVLAKEKIICQKVGDGSGQITHIGVGYTHNAMNRLNEIEAELKEVVETLEKLRKSVSDLRMGGHTLSLEKRELLKLLVEQRTLYEEKHQALLAEKKEKQEKLREARLGFADCEELRPPVHVTIGGWKAELERWEKHCHIHIGMGQIVTR